MKKIICSIFSITLIATSVYSAYDKSEILTNNIFLHSINSYIHIDVDFFKYNGIYGMLEYQNSFFILPRLSFDSGITVLGSSYFDVSRRFSYIVCSLITGSSYYFNDKDLIPYLSINLGFFVQPTYIGIYDFDFGFNPSIKFGILKEVIDRLYLNIAIEYNYPMYIPSDSYLRYNTAGIELVFGIAIYWNKSAQQAAGAVK